MVVEHHGTSQDFVGRRYTSSWKFGNLAGRPKSMGCRAATIDRSRVGKDVERRW